MGRRDENEDGGEMRKKRGRGHYERTFESMKTLKASHSFNKCFFAFTLTATSVDRRNSQLS